MEHSESVAIAQWVQAGGVVAFATLVYLELRAVRPLLRSLDLAVQVLLERERQRSGPVRKLSQSEIAE